MTARRTATIRLQLDNADAPLSVEDARAVLGEAVNALADAAYVTEATLDTSAPRRPHHTPGELAEEAARAVVAARGFEHTEGEPYLAALGWALGGQVTYERGLALFATAVADIARNAGRA